MFKGKIIVWGAGTAGKLFIDNFNTLDIKYIVDTDIKKKGLEYCGYIIKSPDEIKNWSEYFVVVASGFYTEIKSVLIEYGLEEYVDFTSYLNRAYFYSDEELLEEMEVFINSMQLYNESKTIMILGNMEGLHQKNVRAYIDMLAGFDSENQWVLFSESPYTRESELKNIKIVDMPSLLKMNQYRFDIKVKSETDILYKNIDDIICIMKHVCGNDVIGRQFFERKCKLAYEFYRKLILVLKPEKVFVWNEFIESHKIFAMVCKELKLDLIYVENGALPGSIVFDRMGQMGESYPAVCCKKFQDIFINKDDIVKAEAIIEYLKEKGLNRYEQKEDNIAENIKGRIITNSPIVLVCGQLDYYSGIVPYNEAAQKYHSPIFASSNEMAEYMEQLAEKNKWNLIYKSHPWLPSNLMSEYNGFICLNEGNINELIDLCDVVVTIVSTVSYIAMIRNKPVVMLGYTQLKGKGCTYEAFKIDEIEEVVRAALENGFTDAMQSEFVRHVARLDKGYLWDDMTLKKIHIGRDIDKFQGGKIII